VVVEISPFKYFEVILNMRLSSYQAISKFVLVTIA
jgi:hypothetical protein